MSPYEVVYPGGAVEHWNEESGETWLRRATDHWTNSIWINPVPRKQLALYAIDADDQAACLVIRCIH